MLARSSGGAAGSVTPSQGRRPHLSTLAFGLIDARLSRVDFFDTAGGEQLARWYRLRRASHRNAGKRDPSA